jgi:hypothetical protein
MASRVQILFLVPSLQQVVVLGVVEVEQHMLANQVVRAAVVPQVVALAQVGQLRLPDKVMLVVLAVAIRMVPEEAEVLEAQVPSEHLMVGQVVLERRLQSQAQA